MLLKVPWCIHTLKKSDETFFAHFFFNHSCYFYPVFICNGYKNNGVNKFGVNCVNKTKTTRVKSLYNQIQYKFKPKRKKNCHQKMSSPTEGFFRVSFSGSDRTIATFYCLHIDCLSRLQFNTQIPNTQLSMWKFN